MNIKETIISEYQKGKIVIATVEGLHTVDIDTIINQPINGLLYDLNRSEETILTFIDDPKWINDFAATKVIRLLKAKLSEYESKYGK